MYCKCEKVQFMYKVQKLLVKKSYQCDIKSMFDTVWIARVVPSRANTAQALIDTGKPCDATDADFSVLHLVGSAKKFTSQVRGINNLFKQWSHFLSNHYCICYKKE